MCKHFEWLLTFGFRERILPFFECTIGARRNGFSNIPKLESWSANTKVAGDYRDVMTVAIRRIPVVSAASDGCLFVLHFAHLSRKPEIFNVQLSISHSCNRQHNIPRLSICECEEHIKCIIVNTLKSAVTLFTPDKFFIVSIQSRRILNKANNIYASNHSAVEPSLTRKGRRHNYRKHRDVQRQRRWEKISQYCIWCLSLSICVKSSGYTSSFIVAIFTCTRTQRIQFEAVKRPYLHNVIASGFRCCRFHFAFLSCHRRWCIHFELFHFFTLWSGEIRSKSQFSRT